MKYEEIIKLLDAGYSRDEILSMQEEPAPQEPAPQEPDPAESEPAPAEDVSEVVKELREAISEIKKEFTAFNIMSARQPAESEKTTDDIIAEIINPTKKKNGGF